MANTQGGSSIHLVDGEESSTLETLALLALRRFGEMSASSVEGDALGLFVLYANEVIDDIRTHPYTPTGYVLSYFKHLSERRPIPDHILVSGLLACYARDQKSKAADGYKAEYLLKLNQAMAFSRFGSGATFEISAPDRPAPEAE